MAQARHRRAGTRAGCPRRGEIYLGTLDPTVSRDIQKTPPALINQNNLSNRVTDLTIVAPIPFTVRFPLNATGSKTPA
jgi:mRNA-degrading endonuclease toxin of MazEF toxin-antitoxin module